MFARRVALGPMTLSASDFYDYLQPQPCDLRTFLFAHGAEPAPPGPYLDVVRELSLRHEASHLATLGPYLDLRSGNAIDREERTRQAVRDGTTVIYQPRLSATVELNGASYQLSGEPDYLIRDGGGYRIRDSKVARHITEKDHPDEEWAMATYFEATHCGRADRSAALIEQVLQYNREDLGATWAVLNWLLAHAG